MKDRKILYRLDLNSRQSFSQVGKKVGLPKNDVADRISVLQEKGIIKSFYTVIDVYKLGFMMTRMRYKYQYTTPDIEKSIIENFVNHKSSTLVASTQGMFNLKVVQIIKDINDFYTLWQETQKKFGYYFQEKSSALFISEMYYAPSYLLNSSEKETREKISLVGRGKKVDIDDMDYEILKLISTDSRMPTTDIAEKIGTNTNKVKEKLKKLKQSGIIQGFRTDIDISKLGYHIFRGNFFLKDYNQRSKIIDYIKFNPNLVFIDTYTGEADLEIEFHLKSMSRLYEIMQDLMEKFPNAISHYKHLNVLKYHKFLYLPTTDL